MRHKKKILILTSCKMLITTKTNTEVNISYKHLTLTDRNKIEVLNKEGYSSRRIAKILGCHHSTIARELKRCNNDYKEYTAEKDKKQKSSLKVRKNKSTNEIMFTIKEKLNLRWSPEQIAGTLYKGKLSFKIIYNWIYSGIIDFDISKLRRKGKSRKSKGCLATFIERKTRFYIALPMKDRSKDSMFEAINKLVKSLPKEALKSFTSDRGKEFACYDEVEKLGIDFCFADPYSAWQRGSNENSNGLLREYYPKKTNLAEISIEELIKNLMELNSRPRKCLNYQTPFELFLHEFSLI